MIKIWMYTCRRWRIVVLFSRWGCEQTSWWENDIIQADVTLRTSAHFALKHNLEVFFVAQRDLPQLPVIALISCQVQQKMNISFTSPEHAEGSDAVPRHVEIKTHLDKGRTMRLMFNVCKCKCFKFFLQYNGMEILHNKLFCNHLVE